MTAIFNNIAQTVGRTPLVRLNSIALYNSRLFFIVIYRPPGIGCGLRSPANRGEVYPLGAC